MYAPTEAELAFAHRFNSDPVFAAVLTLVTSAVVLGFWALAYRRLEKMRAELHELTKDSAFPVEIDVETRMTVVVAGTILLGGLLLFAHTPIVLLMFGPTALVCILAPLLAE